MADAVLNGYLTNGVQSIDFSVEAECNSTPTGSIAGVINNIYTGGPQLEDFTFTSATPLLVGVHEVLNMIHIVFENVTVTNVTTSEIFSGSTAIVTANSTGINTWEGSITVLFETHVLTFFGQFKGSLIENDTVICQPPL